MSDGIYRYMNFNQSESFQKSANSLTLTDIKKPHFGGVFYVRHINAIRFLHIGITGIGMVSDITNPFELRNLFHQCLLNTLF